MQKLDLIQVGNPILVEPCLQYANTEILEPVTKTLVKDMKYTLRKVGGVGLAAPQVAINKKLCIIRISPTKYRPTLIRVPVYAMFNPRIVSFGKDIEYGWEGCFSVAEANLFMKVKRSQTIAVSYLDEKGIKRQVEKKGLEAIVIQHEIDHLNGLNFLDRQPDLKTAMSGKEYRAMQNRKLDKNTTA